MTDEEKAEEYVDALLNKDDAEIDKFLDENLGDLQLNERQAGTLLGIIKGVGICSFLEGLRVGRLKWHKVADGDYPPCQRGNYSINVLIDCGDIAYYNYEDECWVVEPSSAEIDPPVAWCEIPKYEGKK